MYVHMHMHMHMHMHVYVCSAWAGVTRCLAAIWATSSFCSSGVPPCLDSKALEPCVGRYMQAVNVACEMQRVVPFYSLTHLLTQLLTYLPLLTCAGKEAPE